MPDASLLSALNTAAEQVWLERHTEWPGLSVEVRPEVGSTNTQLLQQGREGRCEPSVLVALAQTAGRGRLGRTWLSTPGDTLTFSVGLPLDLQAVPGGGSALSLAVGLALAESLDALSPHGAIGLKWPNDLWVGERKLGGILIEATPAPGLPPSQRWVVIGVGLNVQGPPPHPDACGLRTGGGASSPSDPALPGQVLAKVLPALLDAVRSYLQTGFAPLQARFAERDVLQGRAVNLWRHAVASTAPGAEQAAQCLGVDADGALLVHTAAGRQRWTSGDVSVRPAPSRC